MTLDELIAKAQKLREDNPAVGKLDVLAYEDDVDWENSGNEELIVLNLDCSEVRDIEHVLPDEEDDFPEEDE